jgi:hypothetical protein
MLGCWCFSGHSMLCPYGSKIPHSSKEEKKRHIQLPQRPQRKQDGVRRRSGQAGATKTGTEPETCVAPAALKIFVLAYPALTRWANLWRAYSATKGSASSIILILRF